MARTLNNPEDIDNYPVNKIVHRIFVFRPGHPQSPNGDPITECAWGPELDESLVEIHPAQEVSFKKAGNSPNWVKTPSLWLGAAGGGS